MHNRCQTSDTHAWSWHAEQATELALFVKMGPARQMRAVKGFLVGLAPALWSLWNAASAEAMRLLWTGTFAACLAGQPPLAIHEGSVV